MLAGVAAKAASLEIQAGMQNGVEIQAGSVDTMASRKVPTNGKSTALEARRRPVASLSPMYQIMMEHGSANLGPVLRQLKLERVSLKSRGVI